MNNTINLSLPDPADSPVVVKIADISFVEVMQGPSGRLVLRIYLRNGLFVDVPATAANVQYLESLGFVAHNKHLITRANDVMLSGPDTDSSPPKEGGKDNGITTPAPQSVTAHEPKKNGNRPK